MSRGRGFSGVSVFAVLQCVQKKQRRAALQIEGGMDLRYRRKLFRLRDPYDIEASQDLFLQAVRETRIAENTVRFLSIFISHLKRCVVKRIWPVCPPCPPPFLKDVRFIPCRVGASWSGQRHPAQKDR